jgi:hypothetical protein
MLPLRPVSIPHPTAIDALLDRDQKRVGNDRPAGVTR